MSIKKLAELVGQADGAGMWNRSHLILRGAVDPAEICPPGEVHRLMTARLMHWPYLTVVKDGVQPPLAELTQTRTVAGRGAPAFVDAAALRGFLADGHTVRLQHVEDWLPAVSDLVEELARSRPVHCVGYIFFTPGEKTGLNLHRDASHVLVVQLEGTKEWTIHEPDGAGDPAAGEQPSPPGPPIRFTLHPGDVLYLPHGWPHTAYAVDAASMHLTVTMAEPEPAALRRGVAALWAQAHAAELEQRSDLHDEQARAGWIASSLAAFGRTVRPEQVVEAALRLARAEG